MACGCSNKSSCNCESGFSSEGIEIAQFQAATYPGYKQETGARGCESTKGKLFDLLLEDFIVPEVGREAYIRVCDGTRWKAGQFVGVSLPGSKIAAFKISEVGTGKLKVLNGCDKSGDNPIFGNPEKGVTIPAKSVLYPVPPAGCESGFALQVIAVLQEQGVGAILELLSDSEDICFTSVKNLGEDEEVHLFGGTRPDCDCAPDASISSCFRKIIKIFTGQGGRTLCMPEVATISFQSTSDSQRRVALFDENGCVKKGPTYSDLKSCENADAHAKDVPFDAVDGCLDGVAIGLTPSEKHLHITSIEVDDPESDDPDDKIIKWVSTGKKYAVIQDLKSSGAAGGTATSGSWLIRSLTDIKQQSDGFVTLSNNVFTITKPGIYKIEWASCFWATNDSQTRIENTNDSNEVYYGLSTFAFQDTGTGIQALSDFGSCIVEVSTTKSFKLMYRVSTTNANGLGQPNSWGPNIYANIVISSL